jgi:hypothetical protein
MSLPKRGKKPARKKSGGSRLRRNKPFNIDPKSVQWENYGSNSTTGLKEGDVIRRKNKKGEWEYGVADGGFGMSPDTIGRAIYVRTLSPIHTLGPAGVVLTPNNDRYLYDDIKKAGLERWNRGEDHIQRIAKKKPKLVGRDKKKYNEVIAKLKAKPSVHNFRTFLNITSKSRVRNIKVGKKRKDGTRMARWEQWSDSRDEWFDASASYLTDVGYVDGW